MTASTPIRVIAVDDHVILRSGIRLLLLTLDDIELVGEAHDGEEALRLSLIHISEPTRPY